MGQQRARTTFWWGQRVINEGDLVDDRDPAIRAAPALFDAIPVVEQATAAPGERRSVRIPRKKES